MITPFDLPENDLETFQSAFGTGCLEVEEEIPADMLELLDQLAAAEEMSAVEQSRSVGGDNVVQVNFRGR